MPSRSETPGAIPMEILHMILGRPELSTDDLLSCALVNHTWSEPALERRCSQQWFCHTNYAHMNALISLSLHRREFYSRLMTMHLFELGADPDSELFALQTTSRLGFPRVHTINIEHCDPFTDLPISDVDKYNRNLMRALELALLFITPRTKKLKLSIPSCFAMTSRQGGAHNNLIPTNWITTLELDHLHDFASAHRFLTLFPHLKNLTLSWNLSDSCPPGAARLMDGIAKYKHLQCLSLSDLPKFLPFPSGDRIQAETIHLTSNFQALPDLLRVLKLQDVAHIAISVEASSRSTIDLGYVLEPLISPNGPRSSTLVSLRVTTNDARFKCTSEALFGLARSYPNLQSFEIRASSGRLDGQHIHDDDIERLAKMLPRLQNLALPVWPRTCQLSCNAIISLGISCRELRSLEISAGVADVISPRLADASREECYFPHLSKIVFHFEADSTQSGVVYMWQDLEASGDHVDRFLSVFRKHFPCLREIWRECCDPSKSETVEAQRMSLALGLTMY